jgi:DNA-binding transcriptional LysR family regulator
LTLHQLRIFWAVAQSATLTKASKQLGLAQPSLSQQLSKLEESVGTKLFERTRNQMILTDAGRFLLRKVQFILNDVDEAEAGLKEFGEGARSIIRLAGLNSAIRVLLPWALAHASETMPEIELDVHEVAPAEALELLYGRRVNIGLIAADSVAQSSVSFKQVPVTRDPYVFAVPSGIDLAGVLDPDLDLRADDRRIVNSCIQFNFGTQHTRRIEQWYQTVLPRHRLVAQCRTYETALSMVQARLGVCLVPCLAAHTGNGPISGVDLYRTNVADRQIVALMPSQYLHLELHRAFVAALQEAGTATALPGIRPMPPFIEHASAEIVVEVAE